jgi:hypothetical protein
MPIPSFHTQGTFVSINFRLANEKPFAPDCIEGYSFPTTGPFRGPEDATKTVRASPSLPQGLQTVPDQAGIYRFTIQARDDETPYIYVGKASSLKGRVCDYVEMTRRLLALYHGCRVWIDGNGFRFVHYEISDALLQNRLVSFDYFTLQILSAQDLHRLEQLEISHTVMQQYTANCYDRILNAMDQLRSPVHTAGLSPAWQTVQSYL